MVKKLPFSDETAEQLRGAKSADETYTDLARRLLQQADSDDSLTNANEQLAPDDLPSLHGDSEKQANERAYEVLDGQDIAYASREQLSPRETVAARKGVDPADYSSAEELREAIRVRGLEEGR